MNATDELRRMLDERGVEWDYGITGAATTKFRANGVDLTFMSMRDGLVCTTILTPEQAITATLGTETCHNADIGAEGYFKCSECGASCSVDWERSGWGEPRHCPNCGRKVVGE